MGDRQATICPSLKSLKERNRTNQPTYLLCCNVEMRQAPKNTDLRAKNSVAGWQKTDKTSSILSQTRRDTLKQSNKNTLKNAIKQDLI